MAREYYEQSGMMDDGGSPQLFNHNSNSSSGYDGYSLFTSTTQSQLSDNNSNINTEPSFTGLKIAANGTKQLKPDIILQELNER